MSQAAKAQAVLRASGDFPNVKADDLHKVNNKTGYRNLSSLTDVSGKSGGRAESRCLTDK
eukprot:gene29213-6177_t